MPEATVVVIATFREDYEKYFEVYSSKIKAFLADKGAVVIRRQLVERSLYGKLSPSLFMAIDFQNKKMAATAFYEQEYIDLLPLRDSVFSDFCMFLSPYGDV